MRSASTPWSQANLNDITPKPSTRAVFLLSVSALGQNNVCRHATVRIECVRDAKQAARFANGRRIAVARAERG